MHIHATMKINVVNSNAPVQLLNPLKSACP